MIPFRIHPEAALEGLAAGDSIEADDPRQAHLFHAAFEGALKMHQSRKPGYWKERQKAWP